jgi:hypothetical protein
MACVKRHLLRGFGWLGVLACGVLDPAVVGPGNVGVGVAVGAPDWQPATSVSAASAPASRPSLTRRRARSDIALPKDDQRT